MEFFQVLIITTDNIEEMVNDLSEVELIDKIVRPYELGSDIFANGRTITASSISRIHIRKSIEKYKFIRDKLHHEEQRERDNFAAQGVRLVTPYKKHKQAFWHSEDVLDNYIQGPVGYKRDKNKLLVQLKMVNQVERKVFIVHGHNEEMKQSVARFIEKIKLSVIILHEQPKKGRTIIEKFEDYSDVCFAVVLLSADDFAYAKDNPDNGKYRARQNVILELGYFLGKLGREKVVAIYEAGKNIEIPSDYNGIEYIAYSTSNAWKLELAKEMKESNLDIDLNDIIE